MDKETYESLYRSLRYPEDIEKVASETGADRELLLVIHTQRASRNVTKQFYRVKAQAARLVAEWERGESFTRLSRRYDFSPILTSMFVLGEKGIGRKEFWRVVRGEQAVSKRVQKEMEEARKHDLIYSPEGAEIQRIRGKWGEDLLSNWLDAQGVKYEMEKDLRSKFSKTPDCLFGHPLKFNGTHISWIESKANFGDPVEFRRNVKKQLMPYTEMFGEGIVVYWFGHLQGLVPPEGIYVATKEFFESAQVKQGVLHGDMSLLVAGEGKGNLDDRGPRHPKKTHAERVDKEARPPEPQRRHAHQQEQRYLPTSHRSNRMGQVMGR